MDRYESASAWNRWLFVFGSVAVVFLATANYGPLFFIDSAAATHPAWHLVHHGHLFVDDGSLRIFAFVEGRDGHLFSNRPPGVIAAALPFYALLSGGHEAPSGIPGSIAAAVFSAAAVATMGQVLERLLSRRAALVAALLLAFGTSVWSVASSELFAHGPDIFWLSLALLLILQRREWWAGIALALGITTRPQIAVIALFLGILAGWAARRIGPVIAIGIPSLAGLLALLFYNKYVFGAFDLRGGYEEYVNAPLEGKLLGTRHDYLLNVLGTFVSGPRGVLTLTPVLLVLIPGLVVGWRGSPWWARAAALGGSAYMLIQWQTQSGTDGFLGGYLFYSYRYSLEPLFLWMPVLAVAYRDWVACNPTRRLLFNVMALFSIWIQGVGALAYDLGGSMPFHPWLAWSPISTLAGAPTIGQALAIVALIPVLILPVLRTRQADPEPQAARSVRP
jgi:hypothetical protein